MNAQTHMQTVVLEELSSEEEHTTEQRQATRTGGTMKLSINVADDLGRRLRRLAFDLRLSESSIVEVALASFYQRGDDEELAQLLRASGATLRRRRP